MGTSEKSLTPRGNKWICRGPNLVHRYVLVGSHDVLKIGKFPKSLDFSLSGKMERFGNARSTSPHG